MISSIQMYSKLSLVVKKQNYQHGVDGLQVTNIMLLKRLF